MNRASAKGARCKVKRAEERRESSNIDRAVAQWGGGDQDFALVLRVSLDIHATSCSGGLKVESF